ncbi:MAG: hypothetical protein JW782_01230 [Candidatus Saganbacteria bacterium]|nr:hypothetical protein [Candidatus Saganbacteria bacterium]
MKKLISMLLVSTFVLSFAAAARAEIGIGYEALTILPHAFTLYYKPADHGWGAKLSSDFGFSAFSNMVKLVGVIATLGLGDFDEVYFYTLSVTKDMSYDEMSRSYLRFGAMVFNGKIAGQTSTDIVPSIGYGWEWQKGLFGSLTGSVEMGFPELLTLGFRHYF